ncbi:MAG: hypothetical protein QM635_05395 [Microbacteriaceae bacterium]
MQWWNDLIDWLGSDQGQNVIATTILPFVAILVAGLIGAFLGRGSTRRVLELHRSELQAAAVAAMIESAGPATLWSSLDAAAQRHAEAQFAAADVRLRLLPATGAAAAADWAAHEIRAMRRDSAGFSFRAQQTYEEFRDRLLEWQSHPRRARRLFALDLERFRFEDASADAELVEQQQRWAAEEAATAASGLSTRELAAAEGGVADLHEPPVSTTPSVTPASPAATTALSTTTLSTALADLPAPAATATPVTDIAAPVSAPLSAPATAAAAARPETTATAAFPYPPVGLGAATATTAAAPTYSAGPTHSAGPAPAAAEQAAAPEPGAGPQRTYPTTGHPSTDATDAARDET